MEFMTLIGLSCLVSLGTLGALFLRRRRPEQESIPSWFLGATREAASRRVRVSVPPLVSFLAVLAFTAAGALLFWPPPESNSARAGQEDALVWVDPTLSAVLSRQQNAFSARAMASRLVAEGHVLHALVAVHGTPAQAQVQSRTATGPFPTRYEIRPLPGLAEVEAFLAEATQDLVPFARPLAEADVLEALQASAAFRGGSGTLLVVSDGQVETVQSLSFLTDAFRSGKLFSTGAPKAFEGARKEIVPSDVLTAWKEPLPAGAQDFALLDKGLASIPLQARPGLSVEDFDGVLSFVSGPRELEKTRPLLTACGDGVGGPQELDPFSDLRAFATFFSLPVRREACVEQGVENTDSAGTKGPWEFRRQSLWIVPLSEEVAGTLGGKGEFWIPRGYEPCCDALVYTAPLRPSDAPNLELVRQAVQLEEASLPASLILAPPPPTEVLAFPSGLQAPSDSVRGDAFVPVTEAADGTPIAYEARRARIGYVRTSLALPNGELGRSSLWSQIWLGILGDAEGSGSPRVAFLMPSSPSDLASLGVSGFAETLDAKTLAFRPVQAGAKVLPGLYRGTQSEKASAAQSEKASAARWTLVGISPFERVENLLSEDEFAATWNTTASDGTSRTAASGEAPHARSHETPRHVAWGMALAGLAACALWVLPWFFRRATSARASRLFLSLLPFLAVPGLTPPHTAHAQSPSLRNFFLGQRPTAQSNTPAGTPLGIPFRIAWCDANIPAEVAVNYTRLRDLLASRGTIEMPATLIAGGCRPGAAEIWWASDAASLPFPALIEHVTLGGGFVLEGVSAEGPTRSLAALETPSIGLRWERLNRRGLLYRSFYLLTTFDGCEPESTWALSLRKRVGALSPVGLATRARFLTNGSPMGSDGNCRVGDEEARERSFINMMYALLTTDYKEDQLQLPEILSRVRNLGLEP
jgi:hypothetical protein